MKKLQVTNCKLFHRTELSRLHTPTVSRRNTLKESLHNFRRRVSARVQFFVFKSSQDFFKNIFAILFQFIGTTLTKTFVSFVINNLSFIVVTQIDDGIGQRLSDQLRPEAVRVGDLHRQSPVRLHQLPDLLRLPPPLACPAVQEGKSCQERRQGRLRHLSQYSGKSNIIIINDFKVF